MRKKNAILPPVRKKREKSKFLELKIYPYYLIEHIFALLPVKFQVPMPSGNCVMEGGRAKILHNNSPRHIENGKCQKSKVLELKIFPYYLIELIFALLPVKFQVPIPSGN